MKTIKLLEIKEYLKKYHKPGDIFAIHDSSKGDICFETTGDIDCLDNQIMDVVRYVSRLCKHRPESIYKSSIVGKNSGMRTYISFNLEDVDFLHDSFYVWKDGILMSPFDGGKTYLEYRKRLATESAKDSIKKFNKYFNKHFNEKNNY